MKPPWLIMLPAGAILWLAGCVHYQDRPVSAEKVAAEFSRRTLTEAGLKAFVETNLQVPLAAWPLPEWRFTNLVLAAFYYHPDLDVARAKWAVATAGKITAAE